MRFGVRRVSEYISNTMLSCSSLKMELDELSNLPSEVIDQILYKIPIKEAVRTCVLSSVWRYKWATLSHLVFDERCDSTLDHSAFVNIVDRILLLHIGPIHKFKLSHQELAATSDIDRWILHLSRNSIKEFILDVLKGSPYKIPSCLFSCQDIIHLELSTCLLEPPPAFKGFRSLKRLDMQYVTLTQDVFENLILCCPFLETLTLMNWKGFTLLKIDAPNLRFLSVDGDFEEVILKNTSNLVDVTICLYFDDEGRFLRSSSNLLNFFAHLPQIQSLRLRNCFLEYLAVGALPTNQLPIPCLFLKFLCIHIWLGSLEEILTVLCLMRSSPALEELELEFIQDDDYPVALEVNSWLDHNWSDQFSQLRLVHIVDFSGVMAELELIRFVLLSSPILESMTVKPCSDNDSTELLKKLLRFKRASVDAEIIYLDP